MLLDHNTLNYSVTPANARCILQFEASVNPKPVGIKDRQRQAIKLMYGC